ncbi:MAG TPA: alpha/beta fold hydrolase [Ideonella sp.]|uniref:dienelactone hydrolase family protein n=1 Tax=Ideonella sp. TaxID=1929293 RepID=UPI002E310331|nr:alpha/beta fold hydrolase [Ideonella sp.]HEX5687389.1 alpha/beta fold hydrolase [Ideonella sp.]
MQDLLPHQHVLIGPHALGGDLVLPPQTQGLVVFAHGSGSSRLSPRNQQVARALNDAGLATLLFDLLHPDEALHRRNVFDIDLLGQRVVETIDWLDRYPALAATPLGLFGASTGAAAALAAAAQRPRRVSAIVSRGGRPDLASPILAQVVAPTLLIVGGDDSDVLALNRTALAQLSRRCDLAVVPRARHLFEEPGALEVVIQLARRWFAHHLVARSSGTPPRLAPA